MSCFNARGGCGGNLDVCHTADQGGILKIMSINIFNRNGVAGAVLQTPSLLIN